MSKEQGELEKEIHDLLYPEMELLRPTHAETWANEMVKSLRPILFRYCWLKDDDQRTPASPYEHDSEYDCGYQKASGDFIRAHWCKVIEIE